MTDHNEAEFVPSMNINTDVQSIVSLFDQLLRVITDENQQLRQGMPASIAGSIKRKANLASQLEQSMSAVRNGQIKLDHADPNLREELVHRGQKLQVVMKENSTQLLAAMQSTRQRINAVMSAMREQARRDVGYNAAARIQSVNAADMTPRGRSV